MNTFISHPDEELPAPVVLIYMDAPGKREELHDTARRLAAVGYYVMLPNLYYRDVHDFMLFRDDPASMQRMADLSSRVTLTNVRADTHALLRYAEADEAADSTRVACVGYCLGGPFALALACELEAIRAAASVHGALFYVDRPDSPHLSFAPTDAELYVAHGALDEVATPEEIGRLDDDLTKARVVHRIEWYEGCHHGFSFPQRATYDKPGSERHWERLYSLLRRNL